MWNSKPQLKIYSYINNSFVLQAIIDDYKSCSWNRSKYSAGNFTIEINYNIPNAQLFKKGQFIQFSDDGRDFGFIENISDNVGASGKASQTRTITGYDCRYLFKRRIIKSLNSTDTWTMTDCGELVMRNLIADQCGVNAETKRQLPITNTIGESGIGEEYTCSEAYSNLYDTLVTIATQSKIMWKVVFDGEKLVLDFTQGEDRSATVRLDTDYESLANGQFSDSLGSYTNAVYVGGQGYSGSREIYEGESAIDNASPSGFDRFESWDDSSTLTEESEYATEAESVLNQYSQTLTLTGAGLAKCPYVYGEQYDVGDTVTVKFNQIEVTVEIQSVTEYWAKGQYRLDFNFGKPTRTLSSQIELLLSKIQSANANAKTTTCTAVKYFNVATETEQSADEVTYDTLGFTGAVGTGKTFTLYLSGQTGAKTYMVYVKNLTGTGKLILTTGVSDSASLALETGSYCVEVYVDTDGNVSSGTMTTNTVESGNTNAVTSGAVNNALEDKLDNTLSLMQGSDVDNFSNSKIEFYKVRDYNIGWGSKDGFILHFPWSNLYASQIAFDDQTPFLAIRCKTNGIWERWKTISDIYDDDTEINNITNDVQCRLGVSSVVVCRRNRFVYMYISGDYTGSPTSGTQTIISSLPSKYQPAFNQTFCGASYHASSPYVYTSRIIIEGSDVSFGETSMINGCKICIGFIYMV